MVLERGGAKVLKHTHFDVGIDGLGCGFGKFYSVADTYYVDIGAMSLQEIVAHYASNGVSLNAQLVGDIADDTVDRVIEWYWQGK